MEFKPFPSIPRLSREAVITEKIDGANMQVCIGDVSDMAGVPVLYDAQGLGIAAARRDGWLSLAEDAYDFAAWVQANALDLLKLGTGAHAGEWWGHMIGREYGLRGQPRRFSLFNVDRWGDADKRPSCCGVVPVLWRGIFDTAAVEACLEDLRVNGSRAAPGFMRPEGVVAYHVLGGVGFKKTLGNDGHKGKRKQGTAAPEGIGL